MKKPSFITSAKLFRKKDHHRLIKLNVLNPIKKPVKNRDLRKIWGNPPIENLHNDVDAAAKEIFLALGII